MRQTSKTVSPMSNEGRNAYVITHITDALLKLLKEKTLNEISISEICDKAQVGRASFYRNFETKQAVLEKYLQQLILEWGRGFEATNDTSKFSETLLQHYYKHKEVYLLLYRQNLSNLIYEQIRWGVKIDESANNIARYIKSTFSGLTFGIVDEWMRLGMQETPEQIIALTNNMNKNQ